MRFVLAAFVITRAIVIAAFCIASPHPVASAGNWDGAWYGSIAVHGYGYARIGAQRDLAFFPLYPLLAAALEHTGLTWPLAGVLLSNAAFLGALAILFTLVRARWDDTTARWSIAVTCAAPPSLFASVAYSEGLFLLLSVLALWFLDRNRDAAASLATAAASAAAAMGTTLAAAVALDLLARNRSPRNVALAAFGFAGVVLYALYCWRFFGDPLAFVHAQRGWRANGFDASAWFRTIDSLLSWNGVRANLAAVIFVLIGAIALVTQHRALGTPMALYGLLAIAVILYTGQPISADRHAYAVVPILIAFGRALRRVPAFGTIAIAGSLALLALDAQEFARFHWVA
jgi:Gpi18-like mannosyltransferase